MNLEDLIVSTISGAKPVMFLALCVIVLFVIVASLMEVQCRCSGYRSGNVPAPNREEQDQRKDTGGICLDEWRKAHAPQAGPDRRPWFFKTVMGRGLVCLLTKVIPIFLPVVWFSLVVMGMLPNPLALFFVFSTDPQPSSLNLANGWACFGTRILIAAALQRRM